MRSTRAIRAPDGALVEAVAGGGVRMNNPLSDRECELVALVAEGLSNGEIGRRNRVQIAVWAVKQGLY